MSLVARLLAAENIRVQHLANAATASFDTKSRTLVLPVWKAMNGDLYDMLVAHEVAHALYSPSGDTWVADLIQMVGEKNFNKLKMYVNVVEDARIERMMKDRYGGLRSTFAKAYRELTVTNPKLLALDRDLNDLPLIDRVNIHYKVGFAVTVPFSAEEMALVKRVAETKTWDEVVALAKELYDLSKQQKQQKQDEQNGGEDSSPQGKSGGEQGEGEESEMTSGSNDSDSEDDSPERGETADEGENQDAGESTEGGEESDEEADADGDAATGDESDGEEGEETDAKSKGGSSTKNDQKSKSDKPQKSEESDAEADESLTEKAIEELSKKNLENSDVAHANSQNTVTMPVFNTENGVVDFKEVIEDLKIMADKGNGYALYQQFLAKNKTAVAALVQEFMRRKAADEAQRTRTADTGSIDPTRLWAYRVSDEIFGSYETKREGKNHGIVFLVDWSGSMNVILKETVEQLCCLVQFCAAAGIPCDVYAFSNGYFKDYNRDSKAYWSNQAGQVRPDAVTLIHFLTASARPAQLKTAMAGLLAWANKGSQGYGYSFGKNSKNQVVDTKYTLNGTPLNAALAAMNTIVPQFKARTGVQIVNLCVLTDGDATDRIHLTSTSDGGTTGLHNREGNIGWRHDFSKVTLQGKRAVVAYEGREADLLRFLRVEQGINALGFRIDSSRSLSSTIKYISSGIAKDTEEYKQMTKMGYETYIKTKQKFLRDNDWVSGNDWHGYTEWFGVSNLKTDETDYLNDVGSESTKAALAKALSAEIGKSKASRPLMARIAQRVSVSAK